MKVNAIREVTDLPRLVQQEVKGLLCFDEHGRESRAWPNWRGPCPFHFDRQMSLYVNQELGLWVCKQCRACGDAFSWLQKTQGLTFRQAVEECRAKWAQLY